jgi:8-oxo-dGTP pyrophosphatase MutT (NUDIX family)
MGEDRTVSESMPLPAAMVRRARDFTGTPASARPAATVVLLRPSDEAFEVYVLRRATTMVFGGVYAFPGGGVDADDRPETIKQDWPKRLGLPEAEARAVVGAAARELFEEAGVLLAGPIEQPDRTVGDVSGPDWEADRAAVQRRDLTMTELLSHRGLRLRDDLLLPWARWITPEFEPRRFDTWFFVALLPSAQSARDVSGEADRTSWVSPAATEELAMLPPTRVMLNELSAYEGIEGVVAASADRDAAEPVMPRVELTDGGAVLHIP